MRKILIFAIIMGCACMSYAQDFDTAWKARADKAVKKLEDIKKQMKTDDSLDLKYEFLLESAFAAFDTMSDLIIRERGKVRVYHLVISYADNGLLDVAYMYDLSTKKYLGVRVDILPRDRSIFLQVKGESEEFFGVGQPDRTIEPLFIFSRKDPFQARVYKRK